jgi:hypothetical protein
MRTAIALSLVAAALGGCAVVPPQAWKYDPTQAQSKISLPPEQTVALTSRVAQLQSERNAIRDRIAAERDVQERHRLYQDLHRVGMELSPLERVLATLASAR